MKKSELYEFHDEHNKLQIRFIATHDHVEHIMLTFKSGNGHPNTSCAVVIRSSWQ
jgi:hypothetical protein